MSDKRRKQFQLDPSVARALAAPGAASKNEHRSRASYDLKPDTIEDIRQIAEELDVNIYAVAQKLLEFAIEEYRAGRLELKRKPVVTTWELD